MYKVCTGCVWEAMYREGYLPGGYWEAYTPGWYIPRWCTYGISHPTVPRWCTYGHMPPYYGPERDMRRIGPSQDPRERRKVVKRRPRT